MFFSLVNVTEKYHSYIYILAISLLLLAQYSTVRAGEAHDVRVPLIFSLEGIDIKTSACVLVKEQVYGMKGVTWQGFRDKAQEFPENLLKETIGAMRNKNSKRLQELTHPTLGRNSQKFGQAAIGYFRVFSDLTINQVWGSYRFDDLLVFFLKIQLARSSGFANFRYSLVGETGVYGFLPYDSGQSLTLQFLSGWFQSDWGPAKSIPPAYCTPFLLKEMTHKVELDYTNSHLKYSSRLLLIGSPLKEISKDRHPYNELQNKISALRKALQVGNWEDYFAEFTERGKKRVTDWFQKSKKEERQKYKDSFINQEPFFVFNAAPLFVVYTHTRSNGVQVIYFVKDRNGQFLLANAAYATTADRVFKSQRFINEATGDKPFEKWKISQGGLVQEEGFR